MIFTPLPIEGAFRIDLEPSADARGFFARAFCAEEFAARGLASVWPQVNLSFNEAAGTIRGLHLQASPAREAKLVRCLRGAVFDVLVDLRPGAARRGQSCTIALSAKNRTMVHVPPGVAHGYQTLEPETELLYFHSAPFRPDCDAGVNPADPALAIAWPLPVGAISPRDAALPGLDRWTP